MATFVLIHAAGDGGWSWHLVEAALRERGHDVVAPDLPADDASAGLWTYAGVVIDAIDGTGIAEPAPTSSSSDTRSAASRRRSCATACRRSSRSCSPR
jgi:pimeloyl-ACP methyl ester carboxylesterase